MSDAVVDVKSPVISCCLMNDVMPMTNGSLRPSASRPWRRRWA
jgi:hypothetical protein